MTVCIAATCDMSGEPKIIMCSDWQVSSDLGSSQTAFKQRLIKKGWYCLFAGDPSAAIQVVRILRNHFIKEATIDETNILPLIQKSLAERKRFLCEGLIQGKFAMSYDSFLKNGKQQLPADRFEQAVRTIETIEIGVECIICGFSGGKFPILVQTDQFCGAWIQESFATVGAGSDLAHASLMHRQHDEMGLLDASIYSVFEAKKWAERNKNVGNMTSFTVLRPDASAQLVKPDGREFLEQKFAEYGPKEVPFDLKLPEGSLSPISTN